MWEYNNGTFLYYGISCLQLFAYELLEWNCMTWCMMYTARCNYSIYIQPGTCSIQLFDVGMINTLTFQRTHKLYMSAWKAAALNYSPACEPNHTEAELPDPSKAPEFPSEPDVFLVFFSLHNTNNPTQLLAAWMEAKRAALKSLIPHLRLFPHVQSPTVGIDVELLLLSTQVFNRKQMNESEHTADTSASESITWREMNVLYMEQENLWKIWLRNLKHFNDSHT